MSHTAQSKLDLLFVCEHALWPQDQGCKIHGSQMALAAARRGASVGVACMDLGGDPAPELLRPLLVPWRSADAADIDSFTRAWEGRGERLRRRVARHQGFDAAAFAGIIDLVRRHRPTAVIGVGMNSVAMLRGLEGQRMVPGLQRIWYAADELIYFNLSCL